MLNKPLLQFPHRLSLSSPLCSARRCTVSGGAGMWASISTYTDAKTNAETTLIRLAMRWPTTLESKFKLCFRRVPGVRDLIPVRYQAHLIGQCRPTSIPMPKWSIPFLPPTRPDRRPRQQVLPGTVNVNRGKKNRAAGSSGRLDQKRTNNGRRYGDR